MKSVLISIQPKWCELIASRKKTIEVRKTKPKLEVPFKVYIYETQGRTETPWIDEDGHEIFKGRGQVIGEFVCDSIDYVRNYGDAVDSYDCIASCLTAKEIIEYATDRNGNFVYTYGWHISDLVIYDKPRELSKFKKPCNRKNDCCTCDRYDYIGHRCYDEITRPPQSWCYVESED
jgi:predicted transcriptional regulator